MALVPYNKQIEFAFLMPLSAVITPSSAASNVDPDVCDKHLCQMPANDDAAADRFREKKRESPPAATVPPRPPPAVERDVQAAPLSDAGNNGAEGLDATGTVSPATNAEKIRTWGLRLKEELLHVPLKPGGGIAYATIAKEINVKLSVFQPVGASRRVVAELVKELGTMPHNEYLEKRHGPAARKDSATRNYGNEAALTLSKYLLTLEAERGFVPESVHEVSTPSYHKVLKAAGIRYPSEKYAYAAERLFRLIDETAGRLGLGPERHRLVKGANGGTLTYEAAAKLADGANGNGHATTTVARRKSCLNKIREYMGKKPADLIGSEFGSGFERMLEGLAATFKNPDSRRHFVANARTWRELIRPHVIAADLPPRLSDALATLMRERGVPNATRLAEMAEVNATTMQKWLRGDYEPLQVEFPGISKLEARFELAPGTLTSRIKMTFGRTVMREEVWPPCLQKSNLRRLVKQHLPVGFASLPLDEREKVGQELLKSGKSNIGYRRALSEARPWRMKQFPAMLQMQWADFVAYKTNRSAGGLERKKRWKSPETGGRAHTQYLTFFSSLGLSAGDYGLGLKEDNFTLAYLVSPTLVEWEVDWLHKRADGVLHTGIRTFLGEVCSILRPKTGYLAQKPELAGTLTPIPGHLRSEDIETWKSIPGAWADACAATHRRLRDFMKEMEADFEFRRDPFAPIQPILDAARPLDFLDKLLSQAFADLQLKTADTAISQALALRDFLIYATLVNTALRLKNLTRLDYRQDNKGQLRKEGGCYVIEIPAEQFKNAESSFFRRGQKRRINRIAGVKAPPYRKVLPEHLTPLFDQYLKPDTGARAILRALRGTLDAGENAVWVKRSGRPARRSTVSAVCYGLTKRYLAYNEATGTGIPGVEPFSAHAVRHITATHLLKVTGSVGVAAAHLQDTDEVVATTYAQFLPEDKTAMATAMLERDRAPPPWATS